MMVVIVEFANCEFIPVQLPEDFFRLEDDLLILRAKNLQIISSKKHILYMPPAVEHILSNNSITSSKVSSLR